MPAQEKIHESAPANLAEGDHAPPPPHATRASSEAILLAPGGKVDPDLVRREAMRPAPAKRSSDGNDTLARSNGSVGAVDDENDNFEEEAESNDDEAGGLLRVTFRLNRDLKKRLDRYLQDRISFMSRAQLQRLIREEGVTVNGRFPKPSTNLRAGDVVVVDVPPPPSDEIPAEDIALNVIYEDEEIIVINKQPNLIVHPARGAKSGTLINALAYHFLHASGGTLSNVGREHARPGVVHRLDRDTTGAIVAAKTDVAHWRLGKQFENRTTDKRYLAIVHGRVEPVFDIIDLPIGKHPKHRELMAVRYDESAKQAVTIYRVREQFDGFALVELELRTGRTHQIRAHLAHLGWPIVADVPYGGRFIDCSAITGNERPADSSERDSSLMVRQALHATTLSIHHPVSLKRMTFTAPLWPDMHQFLDLLRAGRRITGPISPSGSAVDLDALQDQRVCGF